MAVFFGSVFFAKKRNSVRWIERCVRRDEDAMPHEWCGTFEPMGRHIGAAPTDEFVVSAVAAGVVQNERLHRRAGFISRHVGSARRMVFGSSKLLHYDRLIR